MFYRIVLQGRTAGTVDLATVKREFARVTGIPEDVTERLFADAPQPLKEGIGRADAERIAGTLRAIGATVTVERDLLASLDAVDGGVRELLPLDHRGPPTIAPGPEPDPAPAPPTAAERRRKRLRLYLRLLVGVLLSGALLVAMAPYIEDALSPSTRPVPAAPTKAATPALAETPAAPVALRASLLHGPWRCTDQRTGMSVYQTLGTDGSFTYHGDTFKEGLPTITDANTPSGWELINGRLVFKFANKPPVAYDVGDFNISQLRYGDGHDLDIQCRRP